MERGTASVIDFASIVCVRWDSAFDILLFQSANGSANRQACLSLVAFQEREGNVRAVLPERGASSQQRQGVSMGAVVLSEADHEAALLELETRAEQVQGCA